MAGYTKNIAVIKGIKGGFSSDGGPLSGLIRTEKYGRYLRVDVTMINFAPLSEGHYAVAVTDGANEEIFGAEGFEGESDVDTSYGFAAAVCFVLKGEVNMIALAICGDYSYAADFAKRAVEMSERQGVALKGAYDDEAIAEENYYEGCGGESGKGGNGGKNSRSGRILREDKEEKQEEGRGTENENDCGICAGQTADKVDAEPIPLARDTGFYRRVEGEIENIFATYPHEEQLESMVENSRWAKISYGKGKYYVFGVIYNGGKARYICYGVPSENGKRPPESLKGKCGYIPAPGGGYHVMYQDADTGASVRIENL